MIQKLMLYVVIVVLLIAAGALITGQFDIHPLIGIAVALAIFVLAAFARWLPTVSIIGPMD